MPNPFECVARWFLVFAGTIWVGTCQAQTYKCKSATGQISYQQIPCAQPSGTGVTSPQADEGRIKKWCTSPDSARCEAARGCAAQGALEATLAQCIQKAEARLRVDEEARAIKTKKYLDAERELNALRNTKREPLAAGNPLEVFRVGDYWENDALVKTLDRYGKPDFLLKGNEVRFSYQETTYSLLTRKRNTTDVPAIYIVTSIERYVERSSAHTSAPTPTIECWQVGAAARKLGAGFFETPGIVDEARRQGKCR